MASDSESTPPQGGDDKQPGKAQKQSSNDKILAEITKRLAEAEALQTAAKAAREHAETLPDDAEEKQSALFEAAEKEKKASKEMKIVQRLQSGVVQGGMGGAGIGAGVGMGLGMGLGTVVGGVASVPTTLVGGLVGVGTGAVHGPWVKLPKMGNGEEVDEGQVQTEERDESEK